jgi:hypothetical protein
MKSINKFKLIPIISVLSISIANATFAEDKDACCSGHIRSFAPISIMGAHLHSKGDSMLGYTYMYGSMHMGNNPSSPIGGETNEGHSGHEEHTEHHMSGNIKHEGHDHGEEMPSNNKAHQHTMQHEMHMLEGMYGITDDFTAMLMLPIIQQRMTHKMPNEVSTTENNGIGDISLTGLHSIYRGDNSLLHGGFGMSFPTADIDDTDLYHGKVSNHPYMMQIGSGTYDLLPSLTYQETYGKFGWGTQGSMVIRLGENDNDYTLGDRYNLSLWAGYDLAQEFKVTSRVTGRFWEDVSGRDAGILLTSDMANPMLQGGNMIEAGVGFMTSLKCPFGLDHGIGIEAAFPISQDVDAGWMKQDWMLTAGWRVLF